MNITTTQKILITTGIIKNVHLGFFKDSDNFCTLTTQFESIHPVFLFIDIDYKIKSEKTASFTVSYKLSSNGNNIKSEQEVIDRDKENLLTLSLSLKAEQLDALVGKELKLVLMIESYNDLEEDYVEIIGFAPVEKEGYFISSYELYAIKEEDLINTLISEKRMLGFLAFYKENLEVTFCE